MKSNAAAAIVFSGASLRPMLAGYTPTRGSSPDRRNHDPDKAVCIAPRSPLAKTEDESDEDPGRFLSR
jgi:hypothetical protein